MIDDKIFEQMEETYGLDLILQQNDIESWQVIKLLYDQGLLDFSDYFFTEKENLDED